MNRMKTFNCLLRANIVRFATSSNHCEPNTASHAISAWQRTTITVLGSVIVSASATRLAFIGTWSFNLFKCALGFRLA